MIADREAPAMEPIPFGSPVRDIPGGCAVAHDIREMSGVARRSGNSETHWAPGERVRIRMDGELLMVPARDAELDVIIGGLTRRIAARTPVYVQLRKGKIAG